MALGREDYAGQQYELAAKAFAKVSPTEADGLEAGFFRGLSLLFSGDYLHAEEAFAAVARVLPLAEVLNNQGVALARRGQEAVPLFRQAVAADPSAADYHFNLAVSLKRQGNTAEALAELAQSLKLHPNDGEAQEALKVWSEPEKPAAAKAPLVHSAFDKPAPPSTAAAPAVKADSAKADLLERIERGFDAAAFHQAALMLDRMDAARLDALPPADRAKALSTQAHAYLDRGLILEAERLYLAALAVDASNAAAHAGVAAIRERTGDTVSARREAVISLEQMPSVDAYLVLGRLNLAADHLDEARQNAAAALQIDPKSKPALDLKQQVETKAGQKK
jgi:tetratricopeptide (TPR) repeat protein